MVIKNFASPIIGKQPSIRLLCCNILPQGLALVINRDTSHLPQKKKKSFSNKVRVIEMKCVSIYS